MSNWVILEGELINMDLVQIIRKVGDQDIHLIYGENQSCLDHQELCFSEEPMRDAMFEKIRQFIGGHRL